MEEPLMSYLLCRYRANKKVFRAPLITELVLVQTETQRVDAFVQHLQRFRVRLARVLAGADVLTNRPVVGRAGAAYVGELAGSGDGGLQALEVLSSVKWLNGKAFRCTIDEFFVEIGTLQIGDNLILPRLFGNGRKVRREV